MTLRLVHGSVGIAVYRKGAARQHTEDGDKHKRANKHDAARVSGILGDECQ